MLDYSDLSSTISALPTIIKVIAELASWIRTRTRGDELAKANAFLERIDRIQAVMQALRSLGLIIEDYNELIFISHELDDHTDRVIKNELRYLREMKDQGAVRKLLSTHVDELLRNANRLNDFISKPKKIPDIEKGKIKTLANEARDSLLVSSGLIRSSRSTLSQSDFGKLEDSLKDAASKLKEILDTSNESSSHFIGILVNLSFQTSGA